MLKDKESFTILLGEDASKEKIIDTVQKISLRKQIKYNRIKLKENKEYSYILYTESKDKHYIFDMARNKRIKLVWKDDTEFYIIDFSKNTKGNIICYLQNEKNNGEKFEFEIIYLNLKSEYKIRKIMLASNIILNEEKPHKYEYYCFYKK